MSKENYKNVTELTGFRSPSEQEQMGFMWVLITCMAIFTIQL